MRRRSIPELDQVYGPSVELVEADAQWGRGREWGQARARLAARAEFKADVDEGYAKDARVAP